MKNISLTVSSILFLIGCGKPQESPSSEAQSKEQASEIKIAPIGEMQPVESLEEIQLEEPVSVAKAESSVRVDKPLETISKPIKSEGADISLHKSIKEGDVQAAIEFLAAGADVNAKDERGETAIFSAVIGGYTELVKMLINKGADVNVKNKAGFTSLHEGAYSGDSDIVALLIDSGADVNAVKADGMTPLDMATFAKHRVIADLLRKHGAKSGQELAAQGK